MNIHTSAIKISINLLNKSGFKPIGFIIGVCNQVQDTLGINNSIRRLNIINGVIHHLYGYDFGQMRFKNFLRQPPYPNDVIDGHKFASQSAITSAIQDVANQRSVK